MVNNMCMDNTLQADGMVTEDGYLNGPFRIHLSGGFIDSIENCGIGASGSGCIAVPGLVQAHVHLGQTLFRGMAEHRSLLPWLEERIWPLEASHTPDTLAVSVIQGLKELFASGCTGLLDMGLVRGTEVIVDILRRSGMRALAGNSLMDRGPVWISEEISWLREETQRIRGCCGGLVNYVYVPRFALSCSDDIWEWMSSLPEDMIKSTHASESRSELDCRAIAECGGNIHFLHMRGFTGPEILLAHCVHLQDREADILRTTGTVAVHCPWTNLRLGSGIADIPALCENGVRIALASDGAACNNRLDLAGDARLAMGLASVKAEPSVPNSKFWLNSITAGAASALGWKNTGSLSEGYTADLVLLRPTLEEWEELELTEDPVRYILELDWPHRVCRTLVNGRTVYIEGDYPTLPELPIQLRDARLRVMEKAASLSKNQPH